MFEMDEATLNANLHGLVWILIIVSFVDMQAQFSSQPRSWTLSVLFGCAALSLALQLWYDTLATAAVFHCCVLMTFSALLWCIDLTWLIKDPPFLPYQLLASLIVLVFSGTRESAQRWLTIGSMDSISVIGSVVLSVLTSLALWVWATFVARGTYGPFEDFLGYMSLPMVPIFAVSNALVEEVEYRGIIMAALFTSDTSGFTHSFEQILQLRPMILISLQAALFAMEHYHAGFPSGRVGFVMVFVWGSILGVLRLYTNGMFLPVAVHIIADAVIGLLLVWRTKRAIGRAKKSRKTKPISKSKRP